MEQRQSEMYTVTAKLVDCASKQHISKREYGKCKPVVCDDKCPKISIRSLSPWIPGEYTLAEGFRPGTDFGEKGLFIYSTLATEGEIYTPLPPTCGGDSSMYAWRPPYWLGRDHGTNFDQYNSNVEFGLEDALNGTPGPIPYLYEPQTPPYSQIPDDYNNQYQYWGGDNLFEGKSFYSDTIATLGHNHIYALIEKVDMHMANPNFPQIAQDLMLASAVSGSGKVFSFFAQTTNIYGVLTDADINSTIESIKYLMNTLIYGYPSVNNLFLLPDGSLNLAEILTVVESFLSVGEEGPLIIEELRCYLNRITRAGTDNPVLLYPWMAAFGMHQASMFSSYLMYKKLYAQKPGSKCYQEALEEVNAHAAHHFDGANQLSGFFGLFISLVGLLDNWLTFLQGSDAATPSAFRTRSRLTTISMIQGEGLRAWNEHLTFFDDYFKVAGSKPESNSFMLLYRIKKTLVDSCGLLSTNSVGLTFSVFDTLIRGRQFYVWIRENAIETPQMTSIKKVLSK